MLPDNLRIKKGDFPLLKKAKGKFFSLGSFSLKLYKQDFAPSRFAVIASKKFFKKSVLRNKAKRRVKSVVAECSDKIGDGFAVLIYINKEASAFLKISFDNIKKELMAVFKKAGLIKND